MDRYKEALDRLRKNHKLVKPLRINACNVLQELVERAEPMEVIPLPPSIKKKEFHGKCPYCQEVYIPRYTYRIGVPVNFCPNCGQAIKWSDDE